MLSVTNKPIMPSVAMLSVIMLSVVMLGVVVPLASVFVQLNFLHTSLTFEDQSKAFL